MIDNERYHLLYIDTLSLLVLMNPCNIKIIITHFIDDITEVKSPAKVKKPVSDRAEIRPELE